MKYAQSKQSGFSLVETLVAITILLIVITGPMKISSSAARSTSFSSEQVVAFFIAQEGAEIAQKARDDLILQNFKLPDTPQDGWDEFSDDTAGVGTYEYCFNGGCGLELKDDDDEGELKDVVDCSNILNCQLYYDENTERDRYTYDNSSEKTMYTRVITFEKTKAWEVKVTSKVTWRTGSQKKPQEVVIENYLFNVYGS